MPEQNAEESLFPDQLDSFTDREAIVMLFEEFLRSAHVGRFRLLAVKGNSGTGKSFLISYLITKVCSHLYWHSGLISFSQSAVPDFRFLVSGLEAMLKGCVPRESLNRFRAKREAYLRDFDQYRLVLSIHQQTEASYQSVQFHVNQQVHINAQLRERELHLRAELRQVLIELIEDSERPCCLFIDGYERLAETDTELASWLGDVLDALARAAPQPFQAMICGWQWPTDSVMPSIQTLELTDFDRAQVQVYLEKQGIIVLTTAPLPKEQEELISAFCTLTQGHPLTLSLAAAYFNELDPDERTALSLQSKRPLFDDKARVQFLEERLLSRLPEPDRTLLERGPILRYFDQEVLQVLLGIEMDADDRGKSSLDDRTYDHFLHYPFLKQESRTSSNGLTLQPTFHSLVRRVRLESLRQHHGSAKEQFHRAMANFYEKRAQVEREREARQGGDDPGKSNNTMRSRSRWKEVLALLKAMLFKLASRNVSRQRKYADWFSEVPEKEFLMVLEGLYHRLQVRDLQNEAFEEWGELTQSAVERWRRKQAGLLLELLGQLVEEGEPFLSSTSLFYGAYLYLYASFLEQEARWQEARDILEEVAKIFEQAGKPAIVATCFNNIGTNYNTQGKLDQALDYHQRALALREQGGDPAAIAGSLNNIASIYHTQGKVEQALDYFKRALALFVRVGDPAYIATALINIGSLYNTQGKLDQALRYSQEALTLFTRVGDPTYIAAALNNIGSLYNTQGKLTQALGYHKRSLALREPIGDPAAIAESLANIGGIYRKQGKVEQALDYYQRALALREQVDDPDVIASSLDSIAFIYHIQGRLEHTLHYLQSALARLCTNFS